MPSKKIFVVLILCVGVVTSVWLVLQIPAKPQIAEQNANNTVSVENYRNIDENATSTDWQKILTKIDTKNQSYTNLTNKNFQSTLDETTMTAQMARDFFSQYLLLKKGGQAVTSDEVKKIADNTLLLSGFAKTGEVVYISSNLHIDRNADINTVSKYKETLNQSLKNRSTQVKEDPMKIATDAMVANDQKEIAKIDDIITIVKDFINDLLSMSVPRDAVVLHLALLNSTSNILSNLEALGGGFTDPIKGLSGFSQYNDNVNKFRMAIKNMNDYFSQKLGSGS